MASPHIDAPTGEPSAEVIADAADTFALLASSQRLHLLWLLARQERDVTTLAEILGASVPLVSQHLAKLRLAGLVSARRDGKRQLYGVDDPHVVSLVDQAIDHHEDLRARV
ncbi:MAG: metalloregulator ArsR/SmtB family transcription factor [Propionibacteriaceae bacterium]|jgi:DNA-binding transcriptional ArsR family regulator|nr:metalloregulator ArsR/SmtB family transcription factor [Propionibacteriaceae bacterium]